jgi:SAM-dependent methyltransferase
MTEEPRLSREQNVYYTTVNHLESCLERHGDSHLSLGWPNAEDALVRHRVMLDLLRPHEGKTIRLLDFGCGLSHLYSYILEEGLQGIEYSGLDISQKFIDASRAKYPDVTYYCMDVLESAEELPEFDYIVINGIFTFKLDMTHEEMRSLLHRLLTTIYPKARVGLAFNAMSKHVDWERDDLFHLPFDEAADFVRSHLSRSFTFRQDYGLYEYTTYVYREPNR